MQLTNNNNENNQGFINKSNSGLISKFIKSISVRNKILVNNINFVFHYLKSF